MALRLSNPSTDDLNQLKKLLEAGLIDSTAIAQAGGYADQNDRRQMQMGQPVFEPSPPQNMLNRMQQDAQEPPQTPLSRAVPGQGFQDLQSGQGVVQQTNPDGSQGPVIRINAQPQTPMGGGGNDMADVTRPIEIAGQGKGYYSKDGKSAIINGQKVMLGYDRARTEAMQDRQMKLDKFATDQAHSKAQMDKIDAETNLLNQKPVGDKAPSGFQFKADGSGLEPIAGGPADFKQQGVYNADTATLQSSMADLDRLATTANTILKNEHGLKGITGVQGMFPNAPGFDAANAQSDLGALKAQVGFGVLQAMRNASKTGGALGNVSDAEGKRLEAALGSLEKAQSLDQFKERLQGIVDFSAQAKDRLSQAYNLKYNPTTQAGGIGARQSVLGQSTDAPAANRPILDSSKAALIEQAKQAIARGAPRDAVNQRLQSQGLGPL